MQQIEHAVEKLISSTHQKQNDLKQLINMKTTKEDFPATCIYFLIFLSLNPL